MNSARRTICSASMAVSLLFVGVAQAYMDRPVVTPIAPTTAQEITVEVTAGYCDGFSNPNIPAVSIDGTRIRMELYTRNFDVLMLCNFPPAATYRFRIGPFPAGTYALQIDWRKPHLAGPDSIETLLAMPLVVTAAAQLEPVPALDPAGLLAAAMVVTGLALRFVVRKEKM